MKTALFIGLLVVIFSGLRPVAAQQNPKLRAIIKDTFPVGLLKYQMSKKEFMNNYGIDDTSRALINMFFRKRTISMIKCYGAPTVGIVLAASFFDEANNVVKKTGHEEGAGIYLLGGLVSTLVGVIILPVDGLVNSLTYSRKKLLYTLVYRERGAPVLPKYLLEIKDEDFW